MKVFFFYEDVFFNTFLKIKAETGSEIFLIPLLANGKSFSQSLRSKTWQNVPNYDQRMVIIIITHGLGKVTKICTK